MGYAISWIAIKDIKLDQVTSVLDMEETDRTETFPESAISGADLPNGWCHIQFDAFENPFLKENVLATISSTTQVVYCQVEEHVMYSKSCCWKNGQFIWSSEHDSQKDLFHLISSGELPKSYSKIKTEYIEHQVVEGDEVDFIFEIPIALAEEITGYRHDATPIEDEAIKYRVLEVRKDSKTASQPWWKFWKNT